MTIAIPNAHRVLVASPEESVLKVAASIGPKADCNIVTASDGREAYGILRESSNFSGAILNLVMPFFDAPEILRIMRSERRLMRIPVVVMIDQESLLLLSECHKSGVMALLQKPFTSSQFNCMLNLIWSQRQSLLTAGEQWRERRRQLIQGLSR